MSLADRIRDNESLDAIATWLDGLDHGQRVEEMYTLSAKLQRTLYERTAANEALTLNDFVSDAFEPGRPVPIDGWNSLPLPGVFRRFQKVFCRPTEGEGRLFGYNEGVVRPLIGPGYFVAVPTVGNNDWTERGAIVVDYFQVPDGPVTASWPDVKPNSKGLQRLVYYQTRDFMRRVSSNVMIGAAFKKEKSMNAFFLLCRPDEVA